MAVSPQQRPVGACIQNYVARGNFGAANVVLFGIRSVFAL